MKLLTLNFLTCAIKACKTSPDSFPLRPREAELAQSDLPYNPIFMRNILPRLDWAATLSTAMELGIAELPSEKPESAPRAQAKEREDEQGQERKGIEADEEILKTLHRVLLETEVMEGKLVCGNCGHEYQVKEGIANFLLPSHLVA